MAKKTKTESRIEFLAKCLERGMTRSAAATALSVKDPKVSKGYAVTLVYQTFSGSRFAMPRTSQPKPKASATSKQGSKSPPVTAKKSGDLL